MTVLPIESYKKTRSGFFLITRKKTATQLGSGSKSFSFVAEIIS